jgi:hypothetical protein
MHSDAWKKEVLKFSDFLDVKVAVKCLLDNYNFPHYASSSNALSKA